MKQVRKQSIQIAAAVAISMAPVSQAAWFGGPKTVEAAQAEVTELAGDLGQARAAERAAFELALNDPSDRRANSRLESARAKVDKLMAKLAAAENTRNELAGAAGVSAPVTPKVKVAKPVAPKAPKVVVEKPAKVVEAEKETESAWAKWRRESAEKKAKAKAEKEHTAAADKVAREKAKAAKNAEMARKEAAERAAKSAAVKPVAAPKVDTRAQQKAAREKAEAAEKAAKAQARADRDKAEAAERAAKAQAKADREKAEAAERAAAEKAEAAEKVAKAQAKAEREKAEAAERAAAEKAEAEEKAQRAAAKEKAAQEKAMAKKRKSATRRLGKIDSDLKKAATAESRAIAEADEADAAVLEAENNVRGLENDLVKVQDEALMHSKAATRARTGEERANEIAAMFAAEKREQSLIKEIASAKRVRSKRVEDANEERADANERTETRTALDAEKAALEAELKK